MSNPTSELEVRRRDWPALYGSLQELIEARDDQLAALTARGAGTG